MPADAPVIKAVPPVPTTGTSLPLADHSATLSPGQRLTTSAYFRRTLRARRRSPRYLSAYHVANFANARPRWEMPFFSSALISANVAPSCSKMGS